MKKRISFILCITLVVASCLCLTACKSNELAKAKDLLENGKYEEAWTIFESMEEDKDAKAYLARFHHIPVHIQVESEEGPAKVEITLNEKNLPACFRWSMGEETGCTDYTYDEKGNITLESVTEGDGSQEITAYTYDEKGYLIHMSETEADGTNTLYDYTNDEKGNPIKEVVKTDEYQNVYEYTYDENGNELLTTATTASGIKSTKEYTYDANGNLIKRDSKMAEDFRIVSEYTYDENNNQIKEEIIQNDKKYTLEYTYDENGNMLTCTYTNPEGNVELNEFVYDADGNITKLVLIYDGETQNTFDYTYDAHGNIISRQHTGLDGVWENVNIEYKLVYIPLDLPEDTQYEMDNLIEL